MLENFVGMLRKRRCTDHHQQQQQQQHQQSDHTDQQEQQHQAGALPTNRTAGTFWGSLFHTNDSDPPDNVNVTGTTAISITTAATTLPEWSQSTDIQLDRPFNLNERFVTVLDQLDARVEKFRKEALGLQEKKDFLLMSIDLIKSNDLLQNMTESERDEIGCYIQRVNARLATVELNVRTVRDNSQEDSLSQINELIDVMITIGDPVMSRQRCQQYLNACSSSGEAAGGGHLSSFSDTYIGVVGLDIDAGPVDKKFESALLGCTLDDQKNIKKRLQALMSYLNKQTVRQ